MDKEALLWEKLDGKKVHCFLCAHECRIADSKRGICNVRENSDGVLFTKTYGHLIASNVDPIEKKPLYHFIPGSSSYSIATVGCNFRCGFCQNWQISQAAINAEGFIAGRPTAPEAILQEAIKSKCRSISYTYTEPTIFFEYAFDIARLAKKEKLYNIFVTNGYMTRKALELIRPYLDAANVDLKSFSNSTYRKTCKARLQPVLDTIVSMKELGIWLEVTTLIIPGENDSEEELGKIAEFLAGTDKNIPWHVSQFHPDYKLTDRPVTPVATLKKARDIGQKAGLRYIYLGNVSEGGNTSCYNCRSLLLERRYMGTNKNNLQNGRCPTCNAVIAGIWS